MSASPRPFHVICYSEAGAARKIGVKPSCLPLVSTTLVYSIPPAVVFHSIQISCWDPNHILISLKPCELKARNQKRPCSSILNSFIEAMSASQRCGTLRLARHKFTILKRPSPRMRPLARTIMGVSFSFRQPRQYQFNRPPMVRAKVKEGVLYMPSIPSQHI